MDQGAVIQQCTLLSLGSDSATDRSAKKEELVYYRTGSARQSRYARRFCPGSLDLLMLDRGLDGLTPIGAGAALVLAFQYLQPSSSRLFLVAGWDSGASRAALDRLFQSTSIGTDRVQWLEWLEGDDVVGKAYDRCMLPIKESLPNPRLNPGACLDRARRGIDVYGCSSRQGRYPQAAVNATSLVALIHSGQTRWRAQYTWCKNHKRPPIWHRPWVR